MTTFRDPVASRDTVTGRQAAGSILSMITLFAPTAAPAKGKTMTAVSPIDSAYDLARSGQYRSVSEVIRRLPAIDRPTVEEHLLEPGARRELILVCSAAWLARE